MQIAFAPLTDRAATPPLLQHSGHAPRIF